jgi:hypothetical protein
MMPLAAAAILLYTSPIWIMLMSVLFFHEKLDGRKLLAMGMAFAWCFLVSGFSGEGITLPGLLAGLGSGIGYGLYSILGTVALRRHSALKVTAFTFLFAAAGSWLVCRPAEMIALFLKAPDILMIPVGGFFTNWTGDADWSRQTQGRIIGPRSASMPAYMQDYAETFAEGAMQTKLDAIEKMLDFSTTHRTLVPSQIVWVFNFMSAFSKRMSLLGYNISLSDGYRDNATHTHAALLQYLESHAPGPVGVVLMDYVGVDESAGYAVRGRETVRTLIEHNFRYMEEKPDCVIPLRCDLPREAYSLQGMRLHSPQKDAINIVREADGKVRKVLR